MKHHLTNRDVINITKAIDICSDHNSGGSYNMAALWVKGSKVVVGYNNLHRSASQHNSAYPEICGFHCELDLFRVLGNQMRGGTVYVGGRKARSNAIMLNTKPCIYCAELLATTNTNWVVYIKDGVFMKSKICDL